MPNLCPSWNRYYNEVVSAYESVYPLLRDSGIKLVEDFSLEDLARSCSGGARVVALFSHWTGDRIEFADGLRGADDVVAAIPRQFDGILDLTVCHPMPVVQAVDAERSCLVKVSRRDVPPDLGFAVYALVFTALKERQTCYLTALEHAWSVLRKKEFQRDVQ